MSGEIPKATLAEINEVLSEHMGLRFPENRLGDLERGLLIACRELGLRGPDHCLHALRGARFSREQVEQLASHLTVGETYFFREPKSFRAMEDTILPDLIARRRRSTRILRFWSAGCSSGEEAYSIAILLQRMIPDWTDWGIVILGTDINPDALRRSERGVYGEWSFRGLGQDFRDRHFTKEGHKRYRINDSVRGMVRFSYLNLAEETSYPSLATNTLAMDVIFCRNVLMYFSKETIRRVTRRFRDSLTDGGWMLTSPSEASPDLFPGFETVNFPGAIFFRKPRIVPAAVPARAGSLAAGEEREHDVGPAGGRKSPPARPRRLGERQKAPPAGGGDGMASDSAGRAGLSLDKLARIVKTRANSGNLPKALAGCERALAVDPLAVRFHYLKAGILQEMGESERATDALRKSLFLERNFAMGHFTLANLYRQQGKGGEARRHFRRAVELFSRMQPEESPPEAEEINAARLREMAEANLRSLQS